MVDPGLLSTLHLRVILVSSSTVTVKDCLEFKVREVMEDWSGIKHTFLLILKKSKMTTYIKEVDIKFGDH